MRLGEKDFGVFEKEKLIFLNKDVFKKICAIEKQRKEDKNKEDEVDEENEV